jgi:hypothetical protein
MDLRADEDNSGKILRRAAWSKKLMKMKNLIMLILVAAVVYPGCTKKVKDYAIAMTGVINYTVGDVKITDAGGSSKAAVPGDIVSEGMRVVTAGKTALADIYFGENAVRVFGDSSLSMNRLAANIQTNGETVELSLEKGKVFSKIIKKLSKDDSFSVKTTTAVAAVRGTEFAVEDAGGKTNVACLEGKVSVKNNEGKEVILEEKQEANVEAGKDIVAKQIAADRMNRMKILTDIKAIQDDIRKSYEQQRDEIRKRFEEDKAVIKKAVEDQKSVDQKNLADQKAADKKNIEDIKGTNDAAKKSVTDAKDKMKEASDVDKSASTDAAKEEMNNVKPKIEKMKIEKQKIGQ